MGKLKCICGNILSDTCGDDGEAFTEDQAQEIDFHNDDCYFAGEGRSILECRKCGALAIEDPIDSCNVKFYEPENKQYNGLFK